MIEASTQSAQTQFVDVMNKDTADRGIELAKEKLSQESND